MLKNFYRVLVTQFVILSTFLNPLVSFCQNAIEPVERDRNYLLNDLLNSSITLDVKLYLQIQPATPINHCNTKNYISIKLEGTFSNRPQFITFDLIYKDCKNTAYIKSMSIPISRNELREYVDLNSDSGNSISRILGTGGTSRYEDHFNFTSENLDKLSNVRITNTYIGGQAQRFDVIEQPTRINIANAPGEENSRSDRAEFNSRVNLSLSGGRLPQGGDWTWYDDDKQQNVIGRGITISYLSNIKKPEALISVIGSTSDRSKSTKPLSRTLFIEVKQLLLQETEILLKSNQFNEALDLIRMLKDSYLNDIAINKKYEEINTLLAKRNEEEEKKALQNIQDKEYNLSQNFPDQDKSIKNTMQTFLNENLYKQAMSDGFYNVDLSVVYKIYDNYYFTGNNTVDLNKSLVQYLNEKKESYIPPKLTYFNKKSTEVNAYGSYNYKIYLSSKILKVSKKNDNWETENFEILNLLNKNYKNTFVSRPNGKYSLNIKTIIIGNNKFFQTSGTLEKKSDGPGNVLYSVFIPSIGRNNVGLKNGTSWTLAIIGLAAISIGSKLYSNTEYDKFIKANDQLTLDKSYKNANDSNKIALISAGLGLTLYSINLYSVFTKGLKNKKNPSSNPALLSITDKIILP